MYAVWARAIDADGTTNYGIFADARMGQLTGQDGSRDRLFMSEMQELCLCQVMAITMLKTNLKSMGM